MLQVPIALGLPVTYEDPSITSPPDREKAFGQWDHVRLYGRDYRDRLEQAGFAVDAGSWPYEGASVYRFGLNERERVYLARKKRRA